MWTAKIILQQNLWIKLPWRLTNRLKNKPTDRQAKSDSKQAGKGTHKSNQQHQNLAGKQTNFTFVVSAADNGQEGFEPAVFRQSMLHSVVTAHTTQEHQEVPNCWHRHKTHFCNRFPILLNWLDAQRSMICALQYFFLNLLSFPVKSISSNAKV